MMNRPEKDLERKERTVQRDERENAADELAQRVPDLTSLSIEIRETRPEGCVSDTYYIRRVVLEQAPALFEVVCFDPRCEDGGYDVTPDIIFALKSRQARFEGHQTCRGTVRLARLRQGSSIRDGSDVPGSGRRPMNRRAMAGTPAPGAPEVFTHGWVKSSGAPWETIGSITLPNRPTTLGEARGGLEVIAGDTPTSGWLRSWADGRALRVNEAQERTRRWSQRPRRRRPRAVLSDRWATG
jgi:hypothetical protein